MQGKLLRSIVTAKRNRQFAEMGFGTSRNTNELGVYRRPRTWPKKSSASAPVFFELRRGRLLRRD